MPPGHTAARWHCSSLLGPGSESSTVVGNGRRQSAWPRHLQSLEVGVGHVGALRDWVYTRLNLGGQLSLT